MAAEEPYYRLKRRAEREAALDIDRRAAAVGDTETPPAPTPMVDALGMLGIDEAMTYQPPLNERYHCGCIRVAKWTRCEAHTTLAHDEEPPVAAPQETPEGEPPLGTCNMDSAFHAKTCGCLDWTPNRSAYSVTEATYLLRSDNTRLEDALAAMTKARDLWKQYADANLARTQELAAALATHTRSLAALRSAAMACVVAWESGDKTSQDLYNALGNLSVALSEAQP